MRYVGRAGHQVSCEASSVAQGERIARDGRYDLALLDVNVAGKLITPVAEIVSSRQLPMIFATGYGSAGLPEQFKRYPCIQKPFLTERLGQAIELATGKATVLARR